MESSIRPTASLTLPATCAPPRSVIAALARDPRKTSSDSGKTNLRHSPKEEGDEGQGSESLPSEIERLVEAESAARSLTISELGCEALHAKYDHNASGGVEQLDCEAVRTRLTLQHYIDPTQSSDLTDAIRETATREAQQSPNAAEPTTKVSKGTIAQPTKLPVAEKTASPFAGSARPRATGIRYRPVP